VSASGSVNEPLDVKMSLSSIAASSPTSTEGAVFAAPAHALSNKGLKIRIELSVKNKIKKS